MSKKGITRCIAVMLIALAFCMTYTPAEAGVSVGGAINPIPTPTNIFTAPGQEVDVIISLTNTSQTTPPDIFQFLPATLTGVTFTIMACADSACTVPLPGTLEFVPVGGNGCVANDPGVTSCSLDLVTDATGNTIAITISGGGVALPPATSGPLDLATVRVRSTAPVSTPGGQFFLRAETGPDDVSATFNSQTATGGMQGSTILVFEAAPCIEVTKECVNPDVCDTTIPFSGVVTNCGNEDLANVTVTDSPSGQVFTIGTLAPGASAPYSGSYTGTLGSNTDTVTAEGTGLISGDTVNATASATCDVTCTACIDVTKECVNPDACDTTIPFSGVVTNCGSDELNNVTVTDSPSGQVFTIGTLAPGASAPYSGTYTGSLGSNTDTVTATGTGTVTGDTVNATASATCDVTCTACIDVTKVCTDTVCDLNIPFSGVVTNCGQDVLNNVIVTDSPSGQVFTIGTLAVGASAPFSGTYGGVLGVNTDTVTATGVGDISQQTVTASATAVCNVSCPPCLNVEKECTNPVECNDTTIPISVTLTNCSELEALANVVVVDDPVVSFTCTPDISVGIPLGGSATCTGSYTGTIGSNIDTVTVTAVGADTGQTVTATATAECTVEPCVFGTCRTPGFWGTHAGVEKPTSNNITLQVITECDGCLSICGESVTNTLLNDANSAVEAMCVSPRGDIRNQLARQLTAASLNCCVSGAGSDCSGLPMWDVVFGECNILCAAEISEAYQICIDALDCLNNGGNILFINDEVACQTGTCEPMDTQEPITQACGENLPNCPEGYMCVDLEDSCHTRVLGVCDDGSICTVENTTDGFCDSDGSKCKPGPAGSSKECSDAIGSKKDPNNCTIIPKPSPAECSDKNQGEECCGADAATCDLIDGI
jgi:hypothetical protein